MNTNKVSALVVLGFVTGVFTSSLIAFQRFVGVGSLPFAFVATLVPLGWLACFYQVVPIRVPGPLQATRSWEASGRLYRTLRVRTFGALLRTSWLRLLNPKVYFDRCARNSAAVTCQLERAEAIHLWGMILSFPYVGYAALRGWWSVLGFVVVLHLAANLYPIFNLRWARSRIARVSKVYGECPRNGPPAV